MSEAAEPKQQAQARLVNKLMAAIMSSTSLTAIEVLGALKVAEAQVVMRMFAARPEAPPAGKIVSLNGAPASAEPAPTA